MTFPPTPTLPIEAPAEITYYFFDIMTGTLLATLPLNGVTFGIRMNAFGSVGGTLNMADPEIQSLNPKGSTTTGRTLMVVDIDGDPIWAGIVWTRAFTKSTRILTIGGNESWSYWGRRIQPVDYTNPPAGPFWNANPAPAEDMAAQFIYDASLTALSAFAPSVMTVALSETFPNIDPIIGSFPISQLQSIDQLVSNLASGGYETGFDYTMQVGWSGAPGSTPVFTALLSYPRAGRSGSSSGIVLMVAGDDVDYTWPEDSTAQAWANWGTGGPGGILQANVDDPTVGAAGWPLLEATTSYSDVNTQDAIVAAAESDLANGEWPVVVPTITLPMFGTPSITDITIGDDARVIIEPDEYFPEGVDTYMRITGIDGKVSDSGLSTMTLTLNMPPATAPVPPPPGI